MLWFYASVLKIIFKVNITIRINNNIFLSLTNANQLHYLSKHRDAFGLIDRAVEENDRRNCPQVALRWLIQKNVLPVPDAKTQDQVLMNNDSVTWNLSADQVARLDDLTAHFGGESAEESI